MNNILVVGGNGFIGSAICRIALSKGFKVTSISSSGRPYRTAKGHTPAWVSQVDWHAADALKPESYAHLLPKMSGVVHTVGLLFEDAAYKKPLQQSDVTGVVTAALKSTGSNPGNPLDEKKKSYSRINRDAALRVCETFVASKPEASLASEKPRTFVYISAEDLGRPVIPIGYIESKRQAELGITQIIQGRDNFRSVYIRPSVVYHAHQRPLVSPIAALLDLSAFVHSKVPRQIPNPASVLRFLGASLTPPTSDVVREGSLDSLANMLVLPPVHVDHVAEAACIALDPDRVDISGPIGVEGIRDIIGWSKKGVSQ